jgi:hypothetical protein
VLLEGPPLQVRFNETVWFRSTRLVKRKSNREGKHLFVWFGVGFEEALTEALGVTVLLAVSIRVAARGSGRRRRRRQRGSENWLWKGGKGLRRKVSESLCD